MNHIQRLIQEREELRAQLISAQNQLAEIERYLCSDKFRNEDYVHVRTDMLPKISALRFALIEGR